MVDLTADFVARWADVHHVLCFDATKGYPGEEPTFQKCSLCGMSGHNRRTCPGGSFKQSNKDRGGPYSQPVDPLLSEVRPAP
eukprot:4027279-Amphidinium_carterae.1